MSRVSKLHPRVEAYGTVDELNATLGVALLAPGLPGSFAQWLARVQNDLLDVGADLSVPSSPRGSAGRHAQGCTRACASPQSMRSGWRECATRSTPRSSRCARL